MVFRCECCSRHVLGFESVKSHLCTPLNQGLSRALHHERCQDRLILPDAEFPYTFQFVPKGCQVAACFLDAVGLDPKYATVRELTEGDYRVICPKCAQARPDKETRIAHWFPGLVSITLHSLQVCVDEISNYQGQSYYAMPQ